MTMKKISTEKIILFLRLHNRITTSEVARMFNVSRQAAHKTLHGLVEKRMIVKFGGTRNAYYVLPENVLDESIAFQKKLQTKNLQEHEVLQIIERDSQVLSFLSDNLKSIFDYAFSEMLNNAIDHAYSETATIKIGKNKNLFFEINDLGIGIFRSIRDKKKLKSELEAVQELLKGKTTTMPKAHSGEGIFFTSRVADVFVLESFEYRLTIDNLQEDIFFEEIKGKGNRKKGTKVSFQIAIDSEKHLSDIFQKYYSDPNEYAFDKTEIHIKLYTLGTVHVSRSQARRITQNLEKFKEIILDFDQVPSVGQAFADEIFRVFQAKHPDIKLIPINMNEVVEFMVQRALNTRR